MGADLIVEWVIVKEDIILDEAKEKMLKAVNNLTEIDEEIRSYYKETTGEFQQEYKIDNVKSDFTEIINYVFDSIKQGYRDITWIKHKGEILYITGGMSWGDNPTDSYDYFYRFNYLPNKILKVVTDER